MRPLPALLSVITALAAPCPGAHAAWLQCAATDTTSAPPTAYLTSLASVTPRRNEPVSYFSQRLQHYIASHYPEAHAVTINCTLDDDQLHANQRYDTAINAGTRRLGWENVRVLLPADWLSDTDLSQ